MITQHAAMIDYGKTGDNGADEYPSHDGPDVCKDERQPVEKSSDLDLHGEWVCDEQQT